MFDWKDWFFPIEYADEEFYIRKGNHMRQVEQSDTLDLPSLGSVTVNGTVQHIYQG